MVACIVYHSETGHTRSVAEYAARASGAVLIPVRDCAAYTAITRYLVGARCARRGEKGMIDPAVIDVSSFDGIAVGSPVWAWHPTPAINAAIEALQGCEGKKGVVFVTSGGMPGETMDLMKNALEVRGMHIGQMVHFNRRELNDTVKLGVLVTAISAMSAASQK